MTRGKFIVLDGYDGVGKTTQCHHLQEEMRKHWPTELVHDPGSSPLGKVIRPLLLDKNLAMTPKQQAALFTVARMATADTVREYLETGIHVIADRWLLSTMVYQGMLGGVKPGIIMDLHIMLVDLTPDAYLLLDAPVETAKMRAERDSRSSHDRFESRPLEWWYSLRNAYIQAAFQFNYRRIDTTGSMQTTLASIVSALPAELRDVIASA